MNRLPATLLLLLVMASAAPAQAGSKADRIGTLLYAPFERELIISARNAEAGIDGTGLTESRLTINGMVRRERQRGTTWINGLRHFEELLPENMPVGVRIETRNISVRGQQVKVGETVKLESGEREDFLPPGSVSRRGTP